MPKSMKPKRKITPHKGGRDEQVNVRCTVEVKAMLDAILAATGTTFGDWLESRVIAEYEIVRRDGKNG